MDHINGQLGAVRSGSDAVGLSQYHNAVASGHVIDEYLIADWLMLYQGDAIGQANTRRFRVTVTD